MMLTVAVWAIIAANNYISTVFFALAFLFNTLNRICEMRLRVAEKTKRYFDGYAYNTETGAKFKGYTMVGKNQTCIQKLGVVNCEFFAICETVYECAYKFRLMGYIVVFLIVCVGMLVNKNIFFDQLVMATGTIEAIGAIVSWGIEKVAFANGTCAGIEDWKMCEKTDESLFAEYNKYYEKVGTYPLFVAHLTADTPCGDTNQ